MAALGDLSDQEIRSQLRLGEDSRWEFKEVKFSGDKPKEPSQDDLADELAALANATGGVMLCGVADDGAIQGMTRAQLDAVEMVVAPACADSIKPYISPVILRKQLDDRAFLLVEVAEGHSLHKSPGGHYQRVGSKKQPMNSDEQLRLAQRRGQSRFIGFDKQTMADTGFATLQEALWKPLLTIRSASQPQEALGKLNLLAKDDHGVFRATVAGILLCCANPHDWLPQAQITATHYRGAGRASGQLDAQTITGPIAQQVDQALKFVVRNMRVASRKAPGRVDLPQYSVQAVFEALVNAVAHRDYSIRGSRIRVSMFEDRLEVASPGSLPNNLSVESMAERQATRNEVLTSVLGRIPVPDALGAHDREYFLERRGDGVPIIFEKTHELSGQWPEYKLINEAELLLTIPAARLEADPDQASIAVVCEGRPLSGVDVLALFPNKTGKQAKTDQDGIAYVELHSTHLPMTVFAGIDGHTAGHSSDWVPSEGPLRLELSPLPGGGSVVVAGDAGHLPILSGRLNPILDSLDRSYLYADNISINQGLQQPVNFRLNEDLHLTDADGREAVVRVIDIVGQSTLLQYQPAP
ncbi:ATP-binding protein [Candidatus Poriferisocius sp.]|uniref:ATP-binding protein n=1 Tax=Candidatus Poriferisocius sp. TaxID=3101276 RepID=UPI003B01F79F